MESRKRVPKTNNDDGIAEFFGKTQAPKKSTAKQDSAKDSGDGIADFLQKKKVGSQDLSDGSQTFDTLESESTSPTQEQNTSQENSKQTIFNSPVLTTGQAQALFDAPKYYNQNLNPKVNAAEFLAKDIDTHAPNIFENIAKATGRALPVADKMSEFDKQQIAKETKLSVMNNLDHMEGYAKTRVNEMRKGIAELENEKINYVDFADSGGTVIKNKDAYDKANLKIAERQKYINDLKNTVAELSVDKIMEAVDLTNFIPKDIGRQIIKRADPELNLQFEQAEKGGTIPSGRKADLERLGIDAARSYINKHPDIENAAQAKRFLNDSEATFDIRNIDATAARVRNKIGEYFYNLGGVQDKSGVFGYSQKNLQDALNDPKLVLTPSERQVAETVVLPTEKRIFGTDIPGSGFARSFRGAIEKSAEGTVKSLLDITGGRSDSDIAADNLSQPENTRYGEIKNRSWISRRLDGVGDLTGQVAMMALTSKGLGSAFKGVNAARALTAFGAEEGVLGKLIINGANNLVSNENMSLFINSYLTAYDNYRQQATELFPGDKQAQEFHAKTMSFLEGASEKIFNDTKVLKAFTGEIAPTVKDITKRFLSHEITADVAKQELKTGIGEYAKKFAKEGTKSVAENAFEEGIIDVADGVSQSVYGGTPFEVAKTGQKALNTFLTTAMNSVLVAGMAAQGAIRGKRQETAFFKNALGNMAANPGEYLQQIDELEANKEITSIEANEKRKIINTASGILKQMPESRLVEPDKKSESKVPTEVAFTPEETTNFLLHAVNQNRLEEKIKNSPNSIFTEQWEKELKRSQDIQRGIFDQSVQVNDDLQEVAADEKQAEKLNIPFQEPVVEQENVPRGTLAPVVEQTVTEPQIIQPLNTQNETKEAVQTEAEGQNELVEPEVATPPVETPEVIVEQKPEKTFKTFREYQNDALTGFKNFRDYIDNYEGETAPETDEEFADEDQVNNYRVDNTQSPTEVAAIAATEEPDSEVYKKSAAKFKELTGEDLNEENLATAINTAFDKLPDEQKALLNEDTTTTDATSETIQEQPVKPIAAEGENPTITREVGPSDTEVKQDGEGTGITHAATEQTREEFGLGDKYEKTTKQDKELAAEAERQIKEGYNIEKLINQLESGKVPSDVETTILKKYKATVEAEIEKNPSKENLDNLKRLVKATDIAGSEQGRALRSRQGLELKDDSLVGYFVREFDSNNNQDLSEKQKETVQKEYNDITSAQKAYEEKIAKLEADLKKAQAEENVKKESTKKKTKKTHEDYAKERQQIVSDMQEKLRKLRGEANVTVIPYLNELITVAPDIAKLTANLVSEGVTKLSDVVASIHSTLKDAIPEITESDVIDLISGKYNEVKPSKNELSEKLYNLKQEAKLVNRLADLQAGIEPTNEKKRKQRSKEIEDLKTKIKNHDLTKIAAAKSNITNQIADIEGKINRGEFENIKPKPLKLDKEATALKDKLIKLRQNREERLLRQKYENRKTAERVKDLALETINVPRAIMSSMDFSAPLRQGLIPTVAHPKMALKAGAEMFKQAFSQARFDRWFHDIRETSRYKLMELSGLYVADPHDPRLGVKEESFMNNLAERIPVIGTLVKGSERAYVSYLNKMRVDLFNRMADGFENEGMTWENNEALYKGAASFINNATGRGGIGVLESAAPILNSAFFSPRLIASRLNILGLSDVTTFGKGFYGSLPPTIRKKALGDLAKTIGVGMTVLGLAAAASLGQKDDDKDKISVEYDPRSSDFGKIKSGNTRWDIWGGFQQYIRVIAQLMSGQTKAASSGKIIDLNGEGMFGKTRGDVVFSFIRGKLAPIPSTAVDFLKGKTVTGDKVTVADEVQSRLLPLVIQDVGQSIQENGIRSLFTVGIPSTFGVSVQNYGPHGFDKVDKGKDATYKFLYDKNVNLPSAPIQGKMTDEEYKKFVPIRDKVFKEDWENAIKNGAMVNGDGKPTASTDQGVLIKDINKLSTEELGELMKSISKKAARVAKSELGITEAIKERDSQERENKAND